MATALGTPVIQGYSRALFSNWLWHRPLQLIVDAGEGLHLVLGSQVFALTHVLLTHGHSDHVLGLPGLLAARKFSKGDRTKPLTILYPADSPAIGHVRDLVAGLWRDVAFPVTWVPMMQGSEHTLDASHVVHAFDVQHLPTDRALGYRIGERRRRLKAEFASLASADIEALARQGRRDELTETFTHPLFVHSGDAMPIPIEWAQDADLLVHDATFLDAKDRREPTHATTEEALQVARVANVSELVLHHLSVRYDRQTVIARLAAQLVTSGFTGRCWLLDDDKLLAIPGRV